MKRNFLPSYEEHLLNMMELRQKGTVFYEPSILNSRISNLSLWDANLPVILNYTTNSYVFFGKNAINVLGQPVEAFYEGGLEFTKFLWNSRDWRVLNQFIFRDNQQFFSERTEDHFENYRISYNFRGKNNSGGWASLLQQSSIVFSKPMVLPVVSMGNLTNITDHKRDSRIIHKIEGLTPTGTWETLLLNFYFPDIEPDRLLTKTETEILKLLLEGLNSEEIAHKWHKSLHTIKTHRKNMLEKTNAKNTVDLMRIAIIQGII